MELVLIAHGKLASEMKRSVEMIVGETNHLTAIEFFENEGLENIEKKLSDEIGGMDTDILIFADLFGGSPFNGSCSYAMKNQNQSIRIISGMSLPLVIEILVTRNQFAMENLIEHIIRSSKDVCREFIFEDKEEL